MTSRPAESPKPTGFELLDANGEVNILLRSLVLLLEQHLGTKQVLLRAVDLEAIQGKWVTIEPRKNSVLLKVVKR